MHVPMKLNANARKRQRMRFKDFLDIDNLKHAKIEEKPVKGFDDYKELLLQNQ